MDGISVVICCYNSARRLPETLKHLAAQRVDDALAWEVIVVDNNSTDRTGAVAHHEWQQYNLPVSYRVVVEAAAGKVQALKKGFASARYSHVLICDDDNWLRHDYLQKASEMVEQYPRLGVLGGYGEPVFEIPPPEWFTAFQGAYAVGSQQAQSGKIREGQLWGAGAVVARHAWKQLEATGFQFLTSKTGKPSGEDSELCFALQLLGYELYYNADLHYKHFIGRERLNWKYCKGLFKVFGRVAPPLSLYEYVLRGERQETPGLKQLMWTTFWNDFRTVTASWKRLCFFLFSDLEGEYYVCNYHYRVQRMLASLAVYRHARTQLAQIKHLQALARAQASHVENAH